MPFRLPSPLHGWRVFAGEVGIIGLGVLIALAAQQAVEELQWQSETRGTEAALEEEIMDSVEVADERLAVSPCLRNRIAGLGSKLAHARGEWRGYPMPLNDQNAGNSGVLPVAYRTPRKYLRTDAWESAKASGVFAHMPRERVAAYSAIYTQIAYFQQLSDIERGAVPSLTFLSFDGSLDDQSRNRAIDTLAQLDSVNLHMTLGGANLVKAAEDLGLRFSPIQRGEVVGLFRRLHVVYGDCARPPKV